ncbi:hypothetical protein NE236_16660 [Actinoallomurus purpureus]|uniref:hypothetical protein n=1 Tax=Actinoallomurus purpureus TaxID=478114 RepID=UPI0020939FC3|nr:hypothetical protein [Actinoallomurus purpureus]MCO6006619.1 hypothetical protein [Actinoallomurus purpureus]
MDLTDRQRKILFAALVVLLAAAGVILTIGTGSGKHKSSAQRGEAASPSPSVPSATAPGTTGPPPSGGSYDIYSLLPFTQKDFSAAADVARRFTIAYGTYRYDEQPSAYLGRMQGMVTTDLAAQLQRDSSAPGVLDQRKQDKEVSTSDAHLDSLRDMEKDQFIFLVTGTQHISKGGSSSDTSQQYAVTVTRSGGGWVVYAFQPANVGDK